ncbi:MULTISPECIES: TIR domain-containing protein [unclassified Mycobacterium]|uniref:nSTAND1 domain-containing NTPase n=1 Tax=unclassified Mycobacterium TaxID=2642494 RepID=UPI0029C61A04|nr:MULTISPECIES: TIR domain-containing protein [unclassified Mycobacterium]
MSRILLSHASADTRQAVALKQWLSQQRPQLANEIYLDVDPVSGIQLGDKWKAQLFQSNSRCEAVICLLSRQWLASVECKTEFRTAENLGKQILCARLEDTDDGDITAEWQRCDLFADGPQTTVAVAGGQPVQFNAVALDRLRRAIEGTGVGPENFVWPPAEDLERAPYRGWEPFDDVDAGVFYGRDAAIVRGLDELRAMRLASAKSLFVVLGPSGSGKSSFLRAGLIPRLQRQDRSFFVLGIMRPERDALTGEHGLAAAIHSARHALKLGGAPLGEVKRACLENPERVLEMLAEIRASAAERLAEPGHQISAPTMVLPLDQAEELFSSDAGPQAEHFLALLADVVSRLNATEVGLIVAATIRTDRYEAMQNHPSLGAVNSALFDELKPMPRAQFKEVITGPASRSQHAEQPVELAPALVEQLLSDAAEGADTLPLLSLTLARLYADWIDAGDEGLTLEDYESMGGMGDVVNNEIELVLASSAHDRPTALTLLRSAFIPWLATINPESDHPMRRVARYDDLPDGSRPLIDALVAKRLVVKDTRGGETVVEVALESLLRQWDELAGWLREERQNLVAADDVERNSTAWAAHDRNPAWLLSGTRLTDAESLLFTTEFGDRMAGTRDYVTASRAAEDERLAAEEQHRQAELRHAQERQQTAEAHAVTLRKRSRVLAVVAVIAVVGAVVAMISYKQANDAKAQAQQSFREATALRLNSDAGDMLAGTNSGGDARAFKELLAARTLGGALDEGSLLEAVVRRATTLKIIDTNAVVNAVAFSGRRAASAEADGTVRLWDAENGQPQGIPLTGHSGWVFSVAFSPDGNRLASAGDDGTVRLWNAETGQPRGAPMTGHARAVNSVVFSPDGHRLASAGTDGTVRLWNADTGQPLRDALTSRTGPVNSVAFSPNGHRLASAGTDGTVRLWNADTGLPQGEPMTGHAGAVNSVAFSPDGHRLATAGGDGTVRLWNADTGQPLGDPMTGHVDEVRGVAFSPDGDRLATAGGDRTVRLWDAHTHKPIGDPMRGHTGAVNGVAFSSDGHQLATAGFDGTVRLWSADGGEQALPLKGNDDAVFGVAFSPDGSQLATAGADGTVRLWDAGTGRQLGNPMAGHAGPVNAVAFSPDGNQVASAGADRTVRLWNAQTGEPRGVLTGHGGAIFGVAFSPDGSRLATASFDHTVRLWDVHARAQVGDPLRGHTNSVTDVVFSPDGQRLASASADETMRLWDSKTGLPVGAPMTGHTGTVRGVAFSPDGRLLASTSYDTTVRLWNADTGQPIGAPMTGHTRETVGVAFSPDGHRVATASADQTVRLWNADTVQALGVLTGHTDRVRDVAFSPDGRRLASASYDKTVLISPAVAEPKMLCDKLTANLSHKQWQEWISPELPYVTLCPGLPIPVD